MLYFPDAQLAYVAVPKTGGTAIESAFEHLSEVKHDFGNLKLMHMSARQIREIYGSGVEIVGAIRHPFDWVCSKYRYLCSEIFPYNSPYSPRLIGFDRFLKRVVRGEKAWPEPHRSQIEYLDGADTIFQYEQFGLLVGYLNNRLGSSVDVPIKNVSPSVNVSVDVDKIAAVVHFLERDAVAHKGAFRHALDGVR